MLNTKKGIKMNNEELEAQIIAKELTAPRVSMKDLEEAILDIEILKHVTKTGKVLRWAIITAQNGFAIVGKPSASVSVENDNAEIGEQKAIANAKNEMWGYLGYELASKLCQTL